MNINWRVRFQNKTFLTGLISLVVVFVYDLLQLLEIAPVSYTHLTLPTTERV